MSTYQGDTNYNGKRMLTTYTVSDGILMWLTVVRPVTSTPVNDVPLPENESAAAIEDSMRSIIRWRMNSEPDADADRDERRP